MKVQSFFWLDRLYASNTTVVFYVGLPLAVSDGARLNTDAAREERGSVVRDLDELSGGVAHYWFIFQEKSGNDILTDFEGGDGIRHVNFRHYGYDSY